MGMLDELETAQAASGAQLCTMHSTAQGLVIRMCGDKLTQSYLIEDDQIFASREDQVVWLRGWLQYISGSYREAVRTGYR